MNGPFAHRQKNWMCVKGPFSMRKAYVTKSNCSCHEVAHIGKSRSIGIGK